MGASEGEIRAEDRRKIIASATDYIESWLDGDPARMARCLHPDLAKREVNVDPKSGEYLVETMSREEMVDFTGRGYGKKYSRPFEVSILDAYKDIATVRVFSSVYMDSLQVARFDDSGSC